MYTLYTANRNYSSWSLRPWVLMSTLGIAFDDRLVIFQPGSNRERFRTFAPNGTVPCLHDGDRVVWDSLAIVEYLAERHAGVWPADADARAWARSAAAEMHAGFGSLRSRCSMSCGVRVRLHDIDAGLAADLARIDELWSEGLSRFGGAFLAGAAFSAVDAFYAPVAFRLQSYGLSLKGAAAAEYAQRLLEIDAMQAWYAAALAEPWRDAPHDAEVESGGEVIADYRAAPAP